MMRSIMPRSVPEMPNGLVMVKPHAVDSVLDPLIEAMLQGEYMEFSPTDDLFRKACGVIEVGTPHVRDLRTMKYGRTLMELFYRDKINRRYFPLITEYYLGEVVFIPLNINIQGHDRQEVYDAIKGTTATFDAEGCPVDDARGIRGLLGEPYQYFNKEEAASFDNETYRKHFTPVVNNFIHVCDSQAEIQEALSYING